MRITRPLRQAQNLLRARWHLRGIPKGRRTRASGRVVVMRNGDIRVGDPMAEDTEMGPLCTSAQLDRVEREVARAESEGGTQSQSHPKTSR